MAAQAAVRELLGTDAGMISLGFDVDTIYERNSIDTPKEDMPLWIVVGWDAKSKAFGSVGPETFRVWVYQSIRKGRYYALINETIELITQIMNSTESHVGADGWRLINPSFQGISAEQFDEGLEALVRDVQFRAATRSIVDP